MTDPDPKLSAEETQAFRRTVSVVRRAVLGQAAGKPGDSAQLIGHMQSGIDRVFEAAQREGVAVACKAGCSYCCRARVEAFAPEAFRIAEELRRLPSPEFADVVSLLQTHVENDVGTASWKDRPNCPFLVDSLCSIYAVRPSACRKGHSLSVKPCEAGAAQIPQSLKIRIGAAALTKGTLEAYAELGFDTAPHELISAVLSSLIDPSVRTRWLAGDKPFE